MFTANLGFVLLFVANPQKSPLFYQELFEIEPIEASPTFVMFALENGVMLGLWSKNTEVVSKIGISATRKLPRLNDRKRAHIS